MGGTVKPNMLTITTQYVKTLRHAYCHPLLRKYIGKRNQWSNVELDTIDWTSLSMACRKHHQQRHFVVKLTHDLLPTRKVTSRYDPMSPTACPFCHTQPETRDHLLQCAHPVSTTWRGKLLSTI